MKVLAHKIIWLIVTLWIAMTINFILPRLMPGDPISIMMNQVGGSDSLNLEALSAAFGINDGRSLWQQYVDYLFNTLQGNLGVSIGHFPTPVTDVLTKAIPWSIGLLGVATLISFILGTTLGVFAAWYRRSALASLSVSAFMFIRAFPYFWLALILVYFLAFERAWFPLGGGVGIGLLPADGWIYTQSILYHALLPGLTIAVSAMGYWMLTVRNNMMNILAEDYITVARAKGLTESRIRWNYAARNALLPSVSGLAMELGFLISGSIVTEIVFSYPGIGFMMFQAVQSKDYPLLQAIFLLIAVAVLLANFIADLVLMWLDPRVREGIR